jgi:hypothetical protein
VAALQKGIYCDIESSEAIFAAMQALRRDALRYRQRHHANRAAIDAYAAPTVARSWGAAFDRFLPGSDGLPTVPAPEG